MSEAQVEKVPDRDVGRPLQDVLFEKMKEELDKHLKGISEMNERLIAVEMVLSLNGYGEE